MMVTRLALLALLVLAACSRDDAPEPKSEPPVAEPAAVAPAIAAPTAATHEVEVVILGMT